MRFYLNDFLLLDSVERATARWRWKRVFFSNANTTAKNFFRMPTQQQKTQQQNTIDALDDWRLCDVNYASL
jgi:hypothetical protein